jgi:SAM-dependent methyltransferase
MNEAESSKMTMEHSGGYDSRAFVAEYYDVVPLHANRKDVPFWLELASKAQGPILELGCGTGRVMLQIARAGYRIDGLDLSSAMLSKCREKLDAQPAEVRNRARLIQGDMTNFTADRTYGLVIIPFRAFQHLIAVADQIVCLRAVHSALAEHGNLVLDLFNPDPARMHDPAFLRETSEFENLALADGRKLGRSSRIVAFHPVEQYNDIELIYYVEHPDGRKERLVHDFPIRLFFLYEVEHLLERCRFRLTDLFGDYDRSPLTDRSLEMIVVAEKALKS